MNHNKSFFAPSWDLLSWSEFKSLSLDSFRLAVRTAKVLSKSPGFAMLVIITALAGGFGSNFFSLVKWSLFDAQAAASVHFRLFVWVAVLAELAFFLTVPLYTLSRMLKTMSELSESEQSVFDDVRWGTRRHAASRSVGVRLLSWLAPGVFTHVFLFFMDAPLKEKSSWPSVKRAFWFYVRLLPYTLSVMVIAVSVVLVAAMALMPIRASAYAVLSKLWLAVSGLYVWPIGAALGLIAVMALLFFGLIFQLASVHVFYNRVMSRHRDLFFDETSEEMNEQN